MKILVVGAGYVGLTFMEALRTRGDTCFATTTSAEKALSCDKVFILDLSDTHCFDEAVHESDAMVLLVAPKKNATYRETYLATAERIAGSLHKRESPYHLIYTSSTSVYEEADFFSVTEEMLLSPPSENGKILLETEGILLNAANTCVLRLGGIFGPGRELAGRARYFSGKELPGLGSEPTNHIHREDIVRGILFCLEHKLTGIYNLVNNDHPTRKDLYTKLCIQNTLPPPLWNPQLPGEKKGYRVSNRKIIDAGFQIIQSVDLP